MKPEHADETRELALEYAHEAMEADSAEEAIRLAEKALALDPHCAEAWLVRAEEEQDEVDVALNAYQKAAESARADLGEEFFQEEQGRFWEVLEARPYMRARLGQALCLYETRRPEEAAAVLEEMLRDNPPDDQGARYILLSLYIELEKVDSAAELLEEYAGDTSPVWLYGRALAEYLRRGPVLAETARARALKAWPGVAEYLGRKRPLPEEDAGEDPDEELLCALEMRAVWEKIPKALSWLLEGMK